MWMLWYEMKLYHLTPKFLYDSHIKHEGLVPQPIDSGYAAQNDHIPENAIFCWPKYKKKWVKDWIIFNKLKTKNKYDDYVLLQVKVPMKSVVYKLKNGDILDSTHTLSVSATGSHGITAYVPHTKVPLRMVVDVIPPEDITPVLKISTYRAEEI